MWFAYVSSSGTFFLGGHEIGSEAEAENGKEDVPSFFFPFPARGALKGERKERDG
jgi:hypothetical protein